MKRKLFMITAATMLAAGVYTAGVYADETVPKTDETYSEESVDEAETVRYDDADESEPDTAEVTGYTAIFTVSEPTKLTEDMAVGSLTINADLDLNGHKLVVTGDLVMTGGTLTLGGGRLEVLGNCTINGILIMRSGNDYLYCGGNFAVSGPDAPADHLTNGTVEIKGDFTQTGGNTRNYQPLPGWYHKTVFSGRGKQTISIANPSGTYGNWFHDFSAPNGNNIVFATPIDKLDLIEDLTIDGDMDITTNNGIDLNGHTLKVKGDFHCSGGTLTVGSGRLETDGNVTISSVFLMQNGNGYIGCGKNFTVDYAGDMPDDHLTNGTVEIKGDFSQKGTNVRNYQAKSGWYHNTVFSGTGTQTISFENYANTAYGNRFNNTDFQNTGNIEFLTPVRDLTLYSDMVFNKDTSLESVEGIRLNGHTVTVNGDFEYKGGKLDINGGKLDINGSLKIKDSTELNLNSGSVSTTGDMDLETVLVMQNGNDKLFCGGNFSISGVDAPENSITNGVTEIKGNFTQTGSNTRNYQAAYGWYNTIIFSGNDTQVISIDQPTGIYGNYFNNLKLQNSRVIFAKPVDKLDLIEDMTIDGDMDITTVKGINLNGHTLKVTGDFHCSGGTLTVGSGRLEVDGDVTISCPYNMNNGNGYLYCGGDFTVDPGDQPEDHLTSGMVEIKGNFTQTGSNTRNYYEAPGWYHKTIFSGTGTQHIHFDSYGNSTYGNRLNYTEFKNSNIVFDTPIRAWVLSDGDYYINGDTELTVSELLSLNGHKLVINGNLTLKGGEVNLDGGELWVYGNFEMPEGSKLNVGSGKLYVQGNCDINIPLYMQNGNGYLYCGGDFTISGFDASEDHLTNGTVNVRGNFAQTEKNSRNYYAAPGWYHTTIFSGRNQKISIANPTGTYRNRLNNVIFLNPDAPAVFESEDKEPYSNISQPAADTSYEVKFEELSLPEPTPDRVKSVKANIPEDAVKHNEHYYKVFSGSVTWEEAKALCEQQGGYLVTITSAEEQAFIESIEPGRVWIGATRKYDNTWGWANGEAWYYTNWADGEPNNSSNVVSDENCVVLWPTQWNDLNNSNLSEQSGYICEWGDYIVYDEEIKTTEYNGHYYAVIQQEMKPEQAEEFCESLGGYLVTITSQEEADFISELASAEDYESFWIGGTDKDDEGSWRWMNGEKWDYTNWYPGGSAGTYEPNNGLGSGEDYVVINRARNYQWVDEFGGYDNYSTKNYFICEWGEHTTDKPALPAFIYGAAMGGENLTAADSAAVLQKVLNSSFVMPIEALTDDYMAVVDVDMDGRLTSADSAIILQKVLSSSFKMPVEKAQS